MNRTWVIAALVPLVCLVSVVTADDSIAVVNPSFQEDAFAEWPGYLGGANPETITGWTTVGSAGINNPAVGYPFADNGLIPDSDAVAFLQGTGSFMQNLAGFDVGKHYWLQLYVNARAGPGGIPEASVAFDGTTLVPTTPVGPVDAAGEATAEYLFVNVPFVPSSAAGDLVISVDAVTGDAALILDGIAVIQRDPGEVVVQNPSFEASGLGAASPGYLGNIVGWNTSGGTGINPANDGSAPFADNGAVPDGRDVALIQNGGGLDQLIAGFEVGQQYAISFAYNARAFDNGAGLAGHLNVTLGNELILDTDVDPVDAAGVFDSPYHQHASVFTATDESMQLVLTHSAPEGADETVLLDSISIRLIPEPASIALLGLGGLLLAVIRWRRR